MRKAADAATGKPPTPALASLAADGHLGDRYGLVLSTVHHLDELCLWEWVVPEPGADEMTIRVYVSAVNFPDTMCVHGLYPTMPDYPFVPCFEVAGIVDPGPQPGYGA
jgi:polyketide synthase PksN